MRKIEQTPGQLTASKQVNDRVNTNVSSANKINVSATGRNVLARTHDQTPENESIIRGGPVHLAREKLFLLRALRTEAEIQDGIRRGILVVV